MSPTLAGGYFTTKATKESGEPSKCSLCITCPLQGRRAKSKTAGGMQHFPRRTSSCCLWGLAPRSPGLSPGPCWHSLSEGLVKQEEVPTRTTRKENPTQGAEWKNLWLINSPSSIEINVPSTAHTKAWSTPPDWKWCKIKKLFFKDLIPESQSQVKYAFTSKMNAWPGKHSHSPAVHWGLLSWCINWLLNPNFIVSSTEKYPPHTFKSNVYSVFLRIQNAVTAWGLRSFKVKRIFSFNLWQF